MEGEGDVGDRGRWEGKVMEGRMEERGVEEVRKMEKDGGKVWLRRVSRGVMVGIEKMMMVIGVVVLRMGWWVRMYCEEIVLGMVRMLGGIEWGLWVVGKWEGGWGKWVRRYVRVDL